MGVASLPAPERGASGAPPARPRYGLALAALALAAFALRFQNLMVVPSIPTIEADLGLPEEWGTWLVSGFLLVSSVSAPILGRLGDQWGAVLPLGYSIVKDELPPERVARSIGILTAVGSLGFGVALTISGIVVDALGWRPLFALAALMLAIAWAGTLLYVPDSSIRLRTRPDASGARPGRWSTWRCSGVGRGCSRTWPTRSAPASR